MSLMHDNAADGSPATASSDASITVIEGIEVAAFTTVVERLRAEYPALPTTRIEAVLMREWEAYTAGRPLVVPVAVEAGVRELLDQA
ncbi:three-helix bundle dimerization domain-containing protein [Microbacterium sp. RD1]|uniref:three-helix bundle dimerization domain-containing protein n=1 Tax=Microbacterium sp. RD1 TaxID=3457313 RepID=UPI003FA5F36D